MKWYVDLGYAINPFERNPIKIDSRLIGYDREVEDLLYLVESGATILIEGPRGSGKTMLLKEIIMNFGGRGRVIYVDAEKLNKRLNIDELLLRNQGFWRKTRGKKPKGMILLIDNAKALSRNTYERMQYYFDQDYLKSIVFATDDPLKLDFPASLFDRIGLRRFRTQRLEKDDAIEMILDRISDDELMKRETAEKLYDISQGDVILLLENCEKVLSYMLKNDLEKIDDKKIKAALESSLEKEKANGNLNVCLECGEELVKVGEFYRCKNCDLYCPECGVLIEEEDLECPSCKAKFEVEEE